MEPGNPMISSLIELVHIAGRVLSVLIIARVLLSWFQPQGTNPIVQWIYRLTEPIMAPVRNLLPQMGGIDFSPILVLFGLQLLEQLLVNVLWRLA